MKFYPLTIARITERIGGLAKTVEFDVPDELADIFSWQAGQHITVQFDIEGENGKQEVRRSYTISASPNTEENL